MIIGTLSLRISYLANSRSIHTVRWAQHFASEGHAVTVVSFDDAPIDGVEVVALPKMARARRLNIVLAAACVRGILRRHRPDIVHAHYVTSYGLAALLGCHRPLIVTAWGSDVFVAPAESLTCRTLVRLVLARADVITSVAPHMTEYLCKSGYARRDKIVTIPFGVDTSLFNAEQRLPDANGPPLLIVSTRRLDLGMDVDVLIRSMATVVKEFPSVRLEIIGDGTLRYSLERLSNELGLSRNVEFRGTLSPREVARHLSRATIFVTTSPSDGNNVSLNEAMACGVFPVAADIVANRAWIVPLKNGLCFPPGNVADLSDALLTAFSNPSMIAEARPINWEIVSTRASWRNATNAMTDLYESVVSRAHISTDGL